MSKLLSLWLSCSAETGSWWSGAVAGQAAGDQEGMLGFLFIIFSKPYRFVCFERACVCVLDVSEADEPDTLLHCGEQEPGGPGEPADWRTSAATRRRGVHKAASGAPRDQESVSHTCFLFSLVDFLSGFHSLMQPDMEVRQRPGSTGFNLSVVDVTLGLWNSIIIIWCFSCALDITIGYDS